MPGDREGGLGGPMTSVPSCPQSFWATPRPPGRESGSPGGRGRAPTALDERISLRSAKSNIQKTAFQGFDVPENSSRGRGSKKSESGLDGPRDAISRIRNSAVAGGSSSEAGLAASGDGPTRLARTALRDRGDSEAAPDSTLAIAIVRFGRVTKPRPNRKGAGPPADRNEKAASFAPRPPPSLGRPTRRTPRRQTPTDTRT